MNIKKISIAAGCGLVAMMLSSIIPMMLYYMPHGKSLAEKFPGVVQASPDMAPAMIGMIIYLFITAVIFDKMGVKSIKEGATTGAWFGGGLWIFINTQMMSLMPGIFEINFVVIDVAISLVMSAVMGAAIGWALERFK
jgi:hypothetical protein